MRDNFPTTAAAPLDQADGLRRMFSGARRCFIPLVANPHVSFSGVVLERVTTALAALGAKVLLVDAADTSPPLPELALIDLAGCIEQLDERTAYLPARGLPRAHVDTRGGAGSLLDVLAAVEPRADVVLLYGEMGDLARVFQRCEVRPILLGADHPESIKHAYAACKIFAQRCGLMTFDLLLAAPAGSRRVRAISTSLAGCADRFLGALLNNSATVDPAVDVADPPSRALQELLTRQLQLAGSPGERGLYSLPTPGLAPASHRDWHATTH